jgi:hypothetical protein
MTLFSNRVVAPSVGGSRCVPLPGMVLPKGLGSGKITAERLRELLHYDPETGVFTWLKRAARRVRVGDVAGCVAQSGYRLLKADGRLYRSHRLAWLWMTGEWPPCEIDHINGDKPDNRWANLRLATRSQNQANQGRTVTNTSGYKGVSWNAKSRKWRAQIRVNGRDSDLGYFASAADAHEAYVVAAKHHFGSFARVK